MELDDLQFDARNAAQRRTLLQVLLLNVILTVMLLVSGITADSAALIANALDNLSDAMVYGISYFAVARSKRWKATAATISGVMLILLAIGVLVESTRRFAVGAEPLGPVMIAMALLAALLNAWCIKLLAREHRADVNLRAAWTFSLNDFLSNFGILVAGGLVSLLGSSWPDLIVGLAIAAFAGYGGVSILRDAYHAGRDDDSDSVDTMQ